MKDKCTDLSNFCIEYYKNINLSCVLNLHLKVLQTNDLRQLPIKPALQQCRQEGHIIVRKVRIKSENITTI